MIFFFKLSHGSLKVLDNNIGSVNISFSSFFFFLLLGSLSKEDLHSINTTHSVDKKREL